jgi:hypothetical protein
MMGKSAYERTEKRGQRCYKGIRLATDLDKKNKAEEQQKKLEDYKKQMEEFYQKVAEEEAKN